MSLTSRHRGFTLTELVIVIVVIGLLIALLMPAVHQAREAARRTHSKNNLKQIGLGLYNYESVFGVFPPGGIFGADGTAYHGWSRAILDFLDAHPPYDFTNFNLPWNDPSNIQPNRVVVPCYINPSIHQQKTADGLALTHYAANDVVFYRDSFTKLNDLTNGVTQTFFVGDARGDFEPWGAPYNWRDVRAGLNRKDSGFGCKVRNFTQMTMADGAVKEFSHQTDEAVFLSFRGENAQWAEHPGDVSKPAYPIGRTVTFESSGN